jgi:hypothetical protein
MEMEYYWVIEQQFGSNNMYWIPDKYYTIYMNPDVPSEIIKILKCIIPDNLTYLPPRIDTFEPHNNILPEIPKKVITFSVTDGMSKVGPIWESEISGIKFLQDKVPAGYLSISPK